MMPFESIEPQCEALRGNGTNASEPSMNKTLTKISSILASEIECSIFEEHVVPALEVARKVLAAQQPEPRAEATAHWWDGEWSFSSITPRAAETLHCDDSPDLWRCGKRAAGRHLDGRTHDEFPVA
jgi:hypothetical protein